MSTTRIQHAGGAVATTLASGIASGDTSMTISASTGWPDGSVGPFYAVIARGTSAEEKVKFSARTGTTLTVASSGRGFDGTTAAAHASGAAIEHCITATEVDDTNKHAADTSVDDHTQYLNTTRHDVTARHTFGAAYGTPAAATTSAVGDSAAAGSAATPAHSDHVHGRESFATNTWTLGTAATAGSATTPARSDGAIAAFDATAPTNSAVGDSAAVGSAAFAARRDHAHGRESFGTPSGTSRPGDSNAAGSATTPARSDHAHARETLRQDTLVASGGVTLTTSNQDVPNCTVTFTTNRTNVKVTVWGTFDFQTNSTGWGTAVGSLVVDGGSVQANQALLNDDGTASNRATVGQSWTVTLATAASHTLKLVVSKTVNAGGVQVNGSHTSMTYLALD